MKKIKITKDNNRNSKSHDKIRQYFLYLTGVEEFKVEILAIRISLDIPKNGFENNSKNVKKYGDFSYTDFDLLDLVCIKYSLPFSYIHILDYYVKFNIINEQEYGHIDTKMIIAEDAFSFIDKLYSSINKILEKEGRFLYCLKSQNKESLSDSYWKSISSIILECKNIRDYMLRGKFDDSFYKPISLNISQYSTKNEILDYVEKFYKTEIVPLQKKYADENIKLGKIRKKNERVKERNNFIYENKDKETKELIGMVKEKYNEIMEYTYINTIIRKETKKRK